MFLKERKNKKKSFEMCYYLLISLIRLNTSTQGAYHSPALPSDHLSRLTFSLIDIFLAEDAGIPLGRSICRMVAWGCSRNVLAHRATSGTSTPKPRCHRRAGHDCAWQADGTRKSTLPPFSSKMSSNLLPGRDKASFCRILVALEKSQKRCQQRRGWWRWQPAGKAHGQASWQHWRHYCQDT